MAGYAAALEHVPGASREEATNSGLCWERSVDRAGDLSIDLSIGGYLLVAQAYLSVYRCRGSTYRAFKGCCADCHLNRLFSIHWQCGVVLRNRTALPGGVQQAPRPAMKYASCLQIDLSDAKGGARDNQISKHIILLIFRGDVAVRCLCVHAFSVDFKRKLCTGRVIEVGKRKRYRI